MVYFQGFDLTIKDQKRVENVVADHLSRLEFNDDIESLQIRDSFPDENLFAALNQILWYAHIVNYLASNEFPSTWSAQDKFKCLDEVKNLFWDYLYKYFLDQIIRCCISKIEIDSVINFWHSYACRGHFFIKKTIAKILQCSFYWPTLLRDNNDFCRSCE